jgi:hypothetical protein
MAIDITAMQAIEAPRDDVSSFVLDHRNDTEWIGGITSSVLVGDPPLRVGSDVRRVASFMGKRIEYVNRVESLEPGWRLHMRSIEAPFPMQVTYAFDNRGGGTVASVRVQGEPSSVYKLAGPLLARRVRRSVEADLLTLKRIMERPSRAS